MCDACTINPYFHVDICEHDALTILPTNVGLTPINNWLIV